MTGKVIYLNGTSSSGKSTLAKALQLKLDTPYLYYGVDTFGWMVNRDWLKEHRTRDDRRRHERAVISALLHFKRSIPEAAKIGCNLIVDDVFDLPGSVEIQITTEVLKELTEVLFVGVHCPLKELKRREKSRKDRPRGIAKGQFDIVHQAVTYDVTVDTSESSVDACCEQIIEALRASEFSAFEAMKAKYLGMPLPNKMPAALRTQLAGIFPTLVKSDRSDQRVFKKAINALRSSLDRSRPNL